MKTIFQQFFLTVALILVAPTYVGATESPESIVRNISDSLQRELQANREEYRADPNKLWAMAEDVMLTHIDNDAVASGVLGKYWRTASDQQRASFQKEFKLLLLSAYTQAFVDLPGWQLNIVASNRPADATDAIVRTKVGSEGGQPAVINYQMHRINGLWKVYDVKIEGISLVKTYQSGFAREVRNSGLDSLIKRLADANRQRGAGA